MLKHILETQSLILKQRFEIAEIFGFESRNRFSIETENGEVVGYAAEQSKGFLGLIFRNLLGHWRRFEIFVFNSERELELKIHHPFRFFFQRIEISDREGQKLGAIQQRFSIFSKRFDLENAQGLITMTVRSPFWSFWTFRLIRNGMEIGRIEKKWSGLLNELFTDRDQFRIVFSEHIAEKEDRVLALAAGLFVDLQYFERKASN